MPTYEGLRLKVLGLKRIKFAKHRKKQLKSTDFTIISNNCWGGMIYESYDLPKQTPTVGLFFMAEDYIKFVSDLKGFVAGDLRFINARESRWKDAPQVSENRRFGKYPVGVISNGQQDIEIFFLHSHSEEEAREKWERRCQRINWNKLLIKFNDQNGCTEDHIDTFVSLPYENKLFFTCKKWSKSMQWEEAMRGGYFMITQRSKQEYIMASYEPFGKNKYVDISRVLNCLL